MNKVSRLYEEATKRLIKGIQGYCLPDDAWRSIVDFRDLWVYLPKEECRTIAGAEEAFRRQLEVSVRQ